MDKPSVRMTKPIERQTPLFPCCFLQPEIEGLRSQVGTQDTLTRGCSSLCQANVGMVMKDPYLFD